MWLGFSNPFSKEKPATEVTDFSVNLVLNQSPSPPQQYTRSKDQDAAEDREEPCSRATGGRKGCARGIADNNCKFTVNQPKQIIRIV